MNVLWEVTLKKKEKNSEALGSPKQNSNRQDFIEDCDSEEGKQFTTECILSPKCSLLNNNNHHNFYHWCFGEY